jgi:hypothetical protein
MQSLTEVSVHLWILFLQFRHSSACKCKHSSGTYYVQRLQNTEAYHANYVDGESILPFAQPLEIAEVYQPFPYTEATTLQYVVSEDYFLSTCF